MFKNRLRTAALAGAIAVATGISGMAVPAYAVDTTQQDGYNTQDGSAAQPVTAQNITEAQLRAKTNGTATYLDALQNGSIEQILNDYLAVSEDGFGAPEVEDGFDPSEEAAKNAFETAREEATRQLAINSQVVQDARASVKFAHEADDAATASWDALVGALQGAVNEINPLIRANNAANTHQGEFPLHTELSTPVSRTNAVDVYQELLALQLDVNGQWTKAGFWNIDVDDNEYVNRTHIATLRALNDAVNARVGVVTPVFEDAVEKNQIAQASDVIVRQLFLERATAQRDVLRGVEAAFAVAERYLELYQNDVLTNDGDETEALSTLYRNVLGNILNGLAINLNLLEDADEAAADFYHEWESDETNNNDGLVYENQKLNFALETYAKVLLNGVVWKEELRRVELIDTTIIAESEALAAELERLEEEREAAKEAARIAADNAAKALAAQEELNRLLAEILAGQNGENPAPTEPSAPAASSGSSENTGIIGLIAAIGGIIGLIAVGFPFIQDFLR